MSFYVSSVLVLIVADVLLLLSIASLCQLDVNSWMLLEV